MPPLLTIINCRSLHVHICVYLDVRSLARLGCTHRRLGEVEKVAREIHHRLLPHLNGLGFAASGRRTGLRRLAWHHLCQRYNWQQHADFFGCKDWQDYSDIARMLYHSNKKGTRSLRRLCGYMNKYYDHTVQWDWKLDTLHTQVSLSTLSLLLKLK